ncbi:hypothetical protein ACYTTR_06480, partial [Cobetia marina]
QAYRCHLRTLETSVAPDTVSLAVIVHCNIQHGTALPPAPAIHVGRHEPFMTSIRLFPILLLVYP